jgi:virginiamycin A acetyltransferase
MDNRFMKMDPFLYKNMIIGDHSFFSDRPKIVGQGNITIGKFCSIAAEVKFITWGHRIDWFSTYTFALIKCPKEGHPLQKNIIIGNDVWIGHGVTILGGAKIGDGAVIGAGSVVYGNIKPYTVVGGNPSQFLFSRFNRETVDLLKKLKWWDLNIETIKNNSDILCSNDYEKLLKFYKEVRK